MSSCGHNPGALAHFVAEDVERVTGHLDAAQLSLDQMRETLGRKRRRPLAMTPADLARGSPRRAEPADAGEIGAVAGELRAAHGLLAPLLATLDVIREDFGTDYGGGELAAIISERVAAAADRLEGRGRERST